MTLSRVLLGPGVARNIWVASLPVCLIFQVALGSESQRKSDPTAAKSVDVSSRIHDRNAWLTALKSRDLHSWKQMFSAATRAGFPSTANAVANEVLFKPSNLTVDAREAIMIPEFEVEALRYLATGARNGRLTVPSDTIRSRTKVVAGRSPAVEHIALFVIADLRKEEDIPYLVAVANRDDPNEYRAAVLALRHMCLVNATKALATLQTLSKNQQKNDFIASTADREKICRG